MASNKKGEGNCVRKCYKCQKEMEGMVENYAYTECGLSSVVLTNVVVFHCRDCGAIVPEIPALGSLHRVILRDLLEKQSLLSGEEIRFVRKAVGYTATALAKVMGVTKSCVSRWETSASDIGRESDRLLRLVCFTKFVETIVGDASNDLPTTVAELGKMVRSWNLTKLLEAIRDEMKGSMRITIDPAKLADYGNTTDSKNLVQ